MDEHVPVQLEERVALLHQPDEQPVSAPRALDPLRAQLLRVLLRAVATRVSRLELAGEPERLRSNFIRGFRRLPLSLEPA